MKHSRLLTTQLLTLASMALLAQSEGGLVVGTEAEKKLGKQWAVGLEAELRTRNDFKTMDRWSVGLGTSYKFNKWLKADAGYTLLNTNFREDISYKASGDYNNWRPSYWGIRHRLHFSLTGTYKFANDLRLSLRERWQYTYRPEQTVTRWDFDNSWWEDKVRTAKSKNQLRSRLQLEYDKKKSLLTPYASIELYNAWKTEKIRYTIGTELHPAKNHVLDVFYRYQDTKRTDDSDCDPDMHYIGVGYKFKF